MDIENEEFLLFLKCAQQNSLRYLCIGGYAVNYYGYHRMTEDMDIWIAPTNENKICFLNTLKCMSYSEQEISIIAEEDFSTYFMCSLGSPPNVIDISQSFMKMLILIKLKKGQLFTKWKMILFLK